MKTKSALIVLVCFALLACNTVKTSTRNNLTSFYQQSITTAMSPDSSKVYNNLVPIDKANKNLIWKTIDGEEYLLVVSWKNNVSYYEPFIDSAFYNTGAYPIWITTAPELIQRMKTENYTDVDLRLKQLLGLPPVPDSVYQYKYFVEFWVKPSDLFRPCPDKEINDAQCELCFPTNTDSTHIEWINENRISRYYPCELFDKYPWTQLGYTYDWKPENLTHVGLSEFVIGTHTNIAVNAIYTTEKYLKKSFY